MRWRRNRTYTVKKEAGVASGERLKADAASPRPLSEYSAVEVRALVARQAA